MVTSHDEEDVGNNKVLEGGVCAQWCVCVRVFLFVLLVVLGVLDGQLVCKCCAVALLQCCREVDYYLGFSIWKALRNCCRRRHRYCHQFKVLMNFK